MDMALSDELFCVWTGLVIQMTAFEWADMPKKLLAKPHITDTTLKYSSNFELFT